MLYRLLPLGKAWEQGMLALPKVIATDYLKLASEYQLKALLIILACDGQADSKHISKVLGCTENDAVDFLEFWLEEGILSCDGEARISLVTQKSESSEPNKKSEKKSETAIEIEKKIEAVVSKTERPSVPTYTQSEIVSMCRDSEELTLTLRNAQEVMGKSLSHVEQELIVNMVTYYGLPCDIVLMILQFYKNEKESGKAIGTAYIAAMARNWSEEGIVTLDAAEEKLHDIERTDNLWKEIISISGLRHRTPTIKQREMISRWSEDFGMDMITIACDIMRENTDKPTLKYVDGVLKNWKKKGIFTPQAVADENKKYDKKTANTNKPSIDETYDIDDINRRAMINDNYDI